MKANWYEELITFLAHRNNINTEVKFGLMVSFTLKKKQAKQRNKFVTLLNYKRTSTLFPWSLKNLTRSSWREVKYNPYARLEILSNPSLVY